MHNILESINTISTEYSIVRILTMLTGIYNYPLQANEVAFEKLFFDYDQPNVIRDKLTETAGNEFTM